MTLMFSGSDEATGDKQLDDRLALEAILRPRHVALIGASDVAGSVGQALMSNLTGSGFRGGIFPINPHHDELLGRKVYRKIGDAPAPIDLAVIATPASTVPGIIAECGAAGVHAAVVVSAGFSEGASNDAGLGQELLKRAREGHVRMLGPNCIGIVIPRLGLNASFVSGQVKPGPITFLSQSGALCSVVADWAQDEEIGLSMLVATGNMADLGWGDLLDYCAHDSDTQCVLMYMESIGNAQAFLSAARELSRRKPIVVLKAGRSAGGAVAAMSHTGSLTGGDDVVDAAFRRAGVLRVNTLEELLDVGKLLVAGAWPVGERLAIVTNAGGPAVLALDVLSQHDIHLAAFGEDSIGRLRGHLPAAAHCTDPVDVLGDASPERFGTALDVVAADPAVDAILAIFTAQTVSDPAKTAEAIAACRAKHRKPMMAAWMGGQSLRPMRESLRHAGVASFSDAEAAARAFAYANRAGRNALGHDMYDTALACTGYDRIAAGNMLTAGVPDGGCLDVFDSLRFLACYGIATVHTKRAATEEEAICAAQSIGFPVALKLLSTILTHKSAAGGVALNLADAGAVRVAFHTIASAASRAGGPQAFRGVAVQPMIAASPACELILGSAVDAQLGPALVVGAGGVFAEILHDRALELPPVSLDLARQMILGTNVAKVLRRIRAGETWRIDDVAETVAALSDAAVDHRRIQAIDINPFIVGADFAIAVDARVVLFPPDVSDSAIPLPAIRPYPAHQVKTWPLHDGSLARLRPIRPDDESLLRTFHQRLSDETVRMRYLSAPSFASRTAHKELMHRCAIDYARQIALVLECGKGEDRAILAVGRVIKIPGSHLAELAIIVADAWQHQGIGKRMVEELLSIAAQEGIESIVADVSCENKAMQHLTNELGFEVESMDVGVWRLRKSLANGPAGDGISVRAVGSE